MDIWSKRAESNHPIRCLSLAPKSEPTFVDVYHDLRSNPAETFGGSHMHNSPQYTPVVGVGPYRSRSNFEQYSLWSFNFSATGSNFCAIHVDYVDFVPELGWRFRSRLINCSPPGTSMVALVDHHEIQGKTGFFTLF